MIAVDNGCPTPGFAPDPKDSNQCKRKYDIYSKQVENFAYFPIFMKFAQSIFDFCPEAIMLRITGPE